jgi:hypothetical protein
VPASSNYVFLQSDYGEYIGGGQTYTYTSFSIGTDSDAHLGVSVNPGTGSSWSGDFVGMMGVAPLRVGYYPDLSRYPFNNPMKGGLDWSGMGRGCNTLTGWFAIDDIGYDAAGNLQHVLLRFEQHCEGAAAALHGQIQWTR